MSSPPESTSTAAAVAPRTTSDIKRVASVGPSLSFNNLTAGPNDTAVNPVTKRPAVVYLDKTMNATGTTAVGALKYAEMRADGQWSLEVVDANYGTAACGTAGSFCVGAPNVAGGARADILSLAFTSDGSPAIAYAYGPSAAGTGNKQIRYAKRTGESWAIEIAFASSTAVAATNVNTSNTVEPLTSVNLRFDSSDRAHLTFAFYAQTLTNSRLKYLFRGASGSWTSSDVTPIASGAGAIAVLGQGMMQGGLALCGGTTPVVSAFNIDAAGGAGKTLFSTCTAVGSDGRCTTWATTNAQTGCGGGTCFGAATITNTSNAGQRTDLAIGAGNRPLLSVYSTATPSNVLYTLLLPNACTTTQPTATNSWGAPTAIGIANDGLNGFELATTATTYFLSFYRGTTATMLTSCPSSSCTWLATPVTIETTTVAREGLAIDVDSTHNQIYISYARNPGAAAGAFGNDIVVAAGTAEDVVSGANQTFPLAVVDNLPDLFPVTAVPTLTSATAPNGMVGFAYFYQDLTAADAKLYYGVRAGPLVDPVFPAQFVTSHQESAAGASVGTFPSLVYTSTNAPVIAYYNGQNRSLDVAVAQMNAGFSVVTVDDHATDDIGQYASAAVSGSTIGVSYYNLTTTGLKYAQFNPQKGWRRFVVDGQAGTGSCGNAAANAGKFSKLAFTPDGRPVIAYQFDGNLRVAYSSEGPESETRSWTCVTIDSNGNIRGEGISMVVSSEGILHLVHFDASLGAVRYVRSAAAIATAIQSAASFSVEIVESTGTTASVVSTPGLALTSTGTLYVSLFSDSYRGLGLATRGESGWTTSYVDTMSGLFPAALGQSSSMSLSSDELPVIFYRSTENWIKYFAREYD